MDLGGRALIAWEPGLGKTFFSLMYAMRHPELRPVVVVCPAYLKWNWAAEAKKHYRLTAYVIEGFRAPRAKIAGTPDLIIVNYDVLHSKTTPKGKLKGWRQYLKEKVQPKLIIFDECSYTKSRTAARTRAVRSLCDGVPHVLALGGTGGMENRPAELFPTLNILRPDIFPRWREFAFRFCAPKKNDFGGWDFKGASHVKALNRLLSGVMIRRRKADVLTQLPKKRRIVTLLDIVQRSEYEEAVNDFVGWVRRNHGVTAGDKAAKVEGLSKLGYLLRLTAQLKMKSVESWLDDWLAESSGKILVYAVHHKAVHHLYERYRDQAVWVTGEVTGKKRHLAFQSFLKDSRIRMLVGNIQAAGMGLSALGVGTTAFIELPWTPGLLNQAEDRTHGIGRGVEGERSEIFYLLARGTIEEMVCKLVQKKATVLAKILDGKRQENDIDVYDKLCEQLTREGK